ncbi:MAG: DUF1152 domain-containing protein [Nitrospirota bacterium]
MHLNLPIIDQLASCENLLIAGMGGGFDLFCGLPIYFELQYRGKEAHLASFSFSDIASLQDGTRVSPTLVGVDAGLTDFLPYFPELSLAQWFAEKRNQRVTIWSFHKTGAKPLLENYRVLIERLSIDGIVLIDGGVDSLVRGDESGMGTFVEDAISLFAVNELKQLAVRIHACLGLTIEPDVAHTQVLENVAGLMETNAFLGGCALAPQMDAYRLYEEAVLYAQGKRYQDPSVINSCIISATRGYFGDHHLTEKTGGSRLHISPLMSWYWFFDLPAVARRNYFLAALRNTDTFLDALHAVVSATSSLPKRTTPSTPL